MKRGFYSKMRGSSYILIVFLIVSAIAFSGCEDTGVSGAAVADANHQIIKQALNAEDPSICEQIDVQSGINSRDTCYSILALATMDASLCNNVMGTTVTDKGEITREVCIERVNKEIERAGKLAEAKKIYEKAFDDPTACNQFADTVAQDVCFENTAVNNRDAGLCEEMENPDGRQECLFRVALLTSDQSICSRLSAESGKYSRDVCYGSIAVNLLEPGICEQISVQSGPFSRDACLGSIAVVTKEKELCDRIVAETGELSREFCLQMIGQ